MAVCCWWFPRVAGFFLTPCFHGCEYDIPTRFRYGTMCGITLHVRQQKIPTHKINIQLFVGPSVYGWMPCLSCDIVVHPSSSPVPPRGMLLNVGHFVLPLDLYYNAKQTHDENKKKQTTRTQKFKICKILLWKCIHLYIWLAFFGWGDILAPWHWHLCLYFILSPHAMPCHFLQCPLAWLVIWFYVHLKMHKPPYESI